MATLGFPYLIPSTVWISVLSIYNSHHYPISHVTTRQDNVNKNVSPVILYNPEEIAR
jgi:hypothetical protein